MTKHGYVCDRATESSSARVQRLRPGFPRVVGRAVSRSTTSGWGGVQLDSAESVLPRKTAWTMLREDPRMRDVVIRSFRPDEVEAVAAWAYSPPGSRSFDGSTAQVNASSRSSYDRSSDRTGPSSRFFRGRRTTGRGVRRSVPAAGRHGPCVWHIPRSFPPVPLATT